jgi:hypothetical protein
VSLRSWRFESSQPHPFATLSDGFLPLSSRGLGRRPLTAETGVRIPVAVLQRPRDRGAFSRSAEPLGDSDDDAPGATQEAEPVDVLVLRHLADELGTVAAQAGDDVVDVLDGEHDAA